MPKLLMGQSDCGAKMIEKSTVMFHKTKEMLDVAWNDDADEWAGPEGRGRLNFYFAAIGIGGSDGSIIWKGGQRVQHRRQNEVDTTGLEG